MTRRTTPPPSSPRAELQGVRALVEIAFGRRPSLRVDPLGKDPARWREVRPLLEWLYDRWFRVELSGAEHLDDEGPTLWVANRGGYLPWDAGMLAVVAHRHGIELRPLVEDETFYLPYVGPVLNRLGAARACKENLEWILARGGHALIFPEGARGSRKPFGRRYQLQPFGGGGFVRIAKRMGARIVPVAVVGSEEATPLLGKISLAPLRLPALPVTPTFPWLGALGLLPLPTPWRIAVGESLSLPRGELDPSAATRTAEEIRARLAAMLRRLREPDRLSPGSGPARGGGAPRGSRDGPRSPAAPGFPG